MGDYDGILNLLKPPGMTSHDGVSFIRRQFAQRKVGHTGTLDPGASGVLPICLGRATRIASHIQGRGKTYRVEMTLGVSTDTHDHLGETVGIETDFTISPTKLGEVLARFVGEYDQVPPMTSARRHRGQRLYELARRGELVDRPARTVTIERLSIVRIIPDDPYGLTFGARVVLDVTCSSGTYVRTLCHDIGNELGCGAHMSFLIRTEAGSFTIEEAVTCEQVERLAREGRLSELLLPIDAGLTHLPSVRVSPGEANRFCHGLTVPCEQKQAGAGHNLHFAEGEAGYRANSSQLVRVHSEASRLLGIGLLQERGRQDVVRPQRVLCCAEDER